MSRTIRKLVDRFCIIVDSAEGDFGEIFRDDFVMGIMPGFPYGCDHEGLSATRQFFADFGAHFEFWAVDTNRFIGIDANNIIITGKCRSRAKATGKALQMETIHLWNDHHGTLTNYKHYCDTAIASAALDHKVPQYSNR